MERAEDIGMISGLRGVASWLQTPDLFRRAALAGVDYVVVPLLSHDAQRHDAFFGAGDFSLGLQCLHDCKKWEVCPVIEIPLIQQSLSELDSLLQLLRSLGVKNVQYYAVADETQLQGLKGAEIIQAALSVHESAEAAEVRYVWQPPVSRKGSLKTVLEEGPRTAGDVSIRVASDGSVYPARGPMVSAGNLLRDDWQRIWSDDVFRTYRQRIESPTRCDVCPGLEICAADCPGDPLGWARGGGSEEAFSEKSAGD